MQMSVMLMMCNINRLGMDLPHHPILHGREFFHGDLLHDHYLGHIL